jgi:hypothetical protein
MAQIKKLGSDKSKQNLSYWPQQHDTPPNGPTTRHPNEVQALVSDQQQRPVADKGGQ